MPSVIAAILESSAFLVLALLAWTHRSPAWSDAIDGREPTMPVQVAVATS